MFSIRQEISFVFACDFSLPIRTRKGEGAQGAGLRILAQGPPHSILFLRLVHPAEGWLKEEDAENNEDNEEFHQYQYPQRPPPSHGLEAFDIETRNAPKKP